MAEGAPKTSEDSSRTDRERIIAEKHEITRTIFHDEGVLEAAVAATGLSRNQVEKRFALLAALEHYNSDQYVILDPAGENLGLPVPEDKMSDRLLEAIAQAEVGNLLPRPHYPRS